MKKEYLTVDELELLKEDLYYEGSEDLATVNYYNGDLGGAISECADSFVSIYTSERCDWLANNINDFDEYIAEMGSTGCILDDIAGAMYQQNTNNYCSELDNIIQNYMINYIIENNYEVTSEELDDITIYDCYDSFNSFEDIQSYVDEEIKSFKLPKKIDIEIAEIEKLEGETLNEKIDNFLSKNFDYEALDFSVKNKGDCYQVSDIDWIL